MDRKLTDCKEDNTEIFFANYGDYPAEDKLINCSNCLMVNDCFESKIIIGSQDWGSNGNSLKKPVENKLGTDDIYSNLGITKNELNEPTDNEPTDNEPTDNEPTDNEPTDNEPTDNEPTDNEPTDNEPTDNEPTDNEPTDNEPTDNEPTDNEPTDNEPTDNEPTDNEPTDNEPTDNEPTDNEPTDNEPTDNEPTDNEPTDNEPTDNEPTDNEPTDNEAYTHCVIGNNCTENNGNHYTQLVTKKDEIRDHSGCDKFLNKVNIPASYDNNLQAVDASENSEDNSNYLNSISDDENTVLYGYSIPVNENDNTEDSNYLTLVNEGKYTEVNDHMMPVNENGNTEISDCVTPVSEDVYTEVNDCTLPVNKSGNTEVSDYLTLVNEGVCTEVNDCSIPVTVNDITAISDYLILVNESSNTEYSGYLTPVKRGENTKVSNYATLVNRNYNLISDEHYLQSLNLCNDDMNIVGLRTQFEWHNRNSKINIANLNDKREYIDNVVSLSTNKENYEVTDDLIRDSQNCHKKTATVSANLLLTENAAGNQEANSTNYLSDCLLYTMAVDNSTEVHETTNEIFEVENIDSFYNDIASNDVHTRIITR